MYLLFHDKDRNKSHATSVISNSRKSVLLGTSALVCLALAAPVMADDFVITSSDGSTNGVGTTNGATAAAIAANAIRGGHTVSLGIALITTEAETDAIFTKSGENEVYLVSPGSISTSSNYSSGIYNSGSNNLVTASGNISTTGEWATGIKNIGSDNITDLSGSITTEEDNAYGIWNGGNSNITTVSGSITTGDVVEGTGNNAYGIYNDGAFSMTTVSGSITTEGEDSTGIYNNGSGSTTTLTSTGVITVNGATTDGIWNVGGQNITIVNGSINVTGRGDDVTGDYASGVDNRGDDNQTTLGKSSQIITTGDYSVAVYAQDDNNITNMHGYISVSGDWSEGISNWGNNNKNNISGSISVTGTTNSNAILVYSGSGNTFTLDEGATIFGDITAMSAATNNKLTFNLGQGASYAYYVGGAGEGTGAGRWDFSDLDGRTQVVTTTGASCPDSRVTVCNLVTGVSTGNLEAQDELQFSMNSSMIGSLSLGSSNSTAPAEAMSFAQTPQNNAWFNIYGDTSDRSASTTKLAFDGSNRGLTIGTPVAISDTLNLDLVFNASNANLDIGSAREQQITARSYNLGAVLRDLAPATGWSVDAFGFVGRNSYDGTRKVMNNQEATGSETVTAAYSGSEVLVGFDAQYSNPVTDTLNFTGGLNASLSNEKIGAYSESKYYAWDARTMTQATGGITAGLEYQKDALTTFASLGLQRSSLQNGKTATYTNNGTAASFTDSSTGDTRRSVTVGFDYAGSESMTFSGAVEAFTSTGGVSGNSARLTANWKF